MNENICKKSKSEKALIKAIKVKYNDNKRKINKNYTNKNAGFGLVSHDIKQLSEMLKMADALEVNNI